MWRDTLVPVISVCVAIFALAYLAWQGLRLPEVWVTYPDGKCRAVVSRDVDDRVTYCPECCDQLPKRYRKIYVAPGWEREDNQP